MKITERIKPISDLELHAPELIQGLESSRQPVILTDQGRARAVLQDIESYEETQETLALLKILALTNRSVEAGRSRPAKEAFADLRARLQREDDS